jgi:hypothetical protein
MKERVMHLEFLLMRFRLLTLSFDTLLKVIKSDRQRRDITGPLMCQSTVIS